MSAERKLDAHDKSECSSLKLLSINSNEQENNALTTYSDNEIESQNDKEPEYSYKTELMENGIKVIKQKLEIKLETSDSMLDWVAVVSEEGEEPIEIPTENDGTILLSSLSAQFSGAIGLKFRNPETNVLRGVRMQDNILYPPNGAKGWDTTIYICTRSSDVTLKPAKKFKKCENAVKRKFENAPVGLLSKNQRVEETEQDHEIEDHEMEEDDRNPDTCDLIVLGLPFHASDEEIRAYFEEYGKLIMMQLKKNKDGTNKGFGFIRFKDLEAQERVILTRHRIKSRWCDVKIPQSQENKLAMDDRKCKIFVSGIGDGVTSADLRHHFEQFGRVTDIYLAKPFRNFAFVTFSEADTAQSLYFRIHNIKGSKVQIKPAEAKGSSENSNQKNNRMQNDYEVQPNFNMGDNMPFGYKPMISHYLETNRGKYGSQSGYTARYVPSPWIIEPPGTEQDRIRELYQRREFN